MISLQKLMPLLTKILNIGYFDGELKKFNFEDGSELRLENESSKFKPLIIIVSRKYYQEALTSYPIVDIKELNKILKMNSGDGRDTYLRTKTENNATWVNKWIFDSTVPEALFVIPESIVLSLLSQQLKATLVVKYKSDSDLYVNFSELGVHSAISNNVLSSPELFQQTCGVVDKPVESIDSDKLPLLLGKEVFKLPIKKLMRFIFAKQKEADLAKFKPLVLTTAFFVAVYFSLTTGFLLYKGWSQERIKAAQSNELTEILTTQTDIDDLISRINTLERVTAQYKNTGRIWEVLYPLFESVNFTAIEYQGRRFILRGEAVKASDILAKLVSNTYVDDAKFDFPISKVRVKERFVISFVLVN